MTPAATKDHRSLDPAVNVTAKDVDAVERALVDWRSYSSAKGSVLELRPGHGDARFMLGAALAGGTGGSVCGSRSTGCSSTACSSGSTTIPIAVS